MKVARMLHLLSAADPEAEIKLCTHPGNELKILSVYSEHNFQGRPSPRDKIVWIDAEDKP